MDLSTEIVSFEVDPSFLLLIKISFIYSAVMDGWKVQKISQNKFSFSKKNLVKHLSLQSFLEKHIQDSIPIKTKKSISSNSNSLLNNLEISTD